MTQSCSRSPASKARSSSTPQACAVVWSEARAPPLSSAPKRWVCSSRGRGRSYRAAARWFAAEVLKAYARSTFRWRTSSITGAKYASDRIVPSGGAWAGSCRTPRRRKGQRILDGFQRHAPFLQFSVNNDLGRRTTPVVPYVNTRSRARRTYSRGSYRQHLLQPCVSRSDGTSNGHRVTVMPYATSRASTMDFHCRESSATRHNRGSS